MSEKDVQKAGLSPVGPAEEAPNQAFVDQWKEHYRLAAQAVLGKMVEGDTPDDFFQFQVDEIERRRNRYPDYAAVIAYHGILGSGAITRTTKLDFPGEDAILGPHPNSFESLLRKRYPTLFEGLEPFVPPLQ